MVPAGAGEMGLPARRARWFPRRMDAQNNLSNFPIGAGDHNGAAGVGSATDQGVKSPLVRRTFDSILLT
jgi:hypothetical protein